MLHIPFPPWPSFSGEEANAVQRVLLSNRVNYWTGNECRQFENEFAEWVQVPHAISLNNGTIALELALRALEIGPGDEVIVTPRSFMASASCAVMAGAIPIFADVSRDTQNLTAETIAKVITPRTRLIIPVHLAGMPCDMDPILDVARSHKLKILEDCAQAHGAKYKGRSVGGFGDIGAWSFCQDKIMTTGGEGGMVTTRSDSYWSAMWSAKDHGKSFAGMQEAPKGHGFRWVHESFGTNGRMLEMQAAVGRMQLPKMPAWSAARRRNAEQIWSAARRIGGLRVPIVPPWAEHAAYKAYVFVENAALKTAWNRDRIIAEVNDRGVPCYSGSCSEIYLEKAFEHTGWRPSVRLPIARELGESSLMFLVHPTLKDENIQQTCDVLELIMRNAVA